MSDKQLCLSCGEPAAPNSGTVPLCSSCQNLAKGKERGVDYKKKRSPREKHA